MHLGISQHLKQSQILKMAPKLIQRMEILQLPMMALKERIEQELRENPLLEEPAGDPDLPETPSPEPTLEAVSTAPVEQRELVVDSDHNNKDDFERLTDMAPEDWPEDDYTYSPRVSSGQMDEDGDRKHDAMANITSRPESLQEVLLDQFRFFTCSPEIRDFADFLIQNIDHNGFLPIGLPEMIEVYGQSISLDEAQEALNLVKRLEPAGVGARDVRECLLLQVKPNTPYREVLMTLITSHLEDIAENRLPVIERKTGYHIELIKEAVEELRKFDPFPGRNFEVTSAPVVTPDLIVDQDEHGKYVVRLEDEYTPRLRISKDYQRMLASGTADQQTKEYFKRRIESARWLIESIEQRYSTLKRVAQAIVDHQTEFLDKGPEYIVPLKMQQIADVVKLHVTTVSRAVDDKWVQTPRGIFPLKRFFGGGTTTADGDEVSWDIIRIKLKEIIDKEDKADPLSDDALVDELAKLGYNLKRRTVTKYRKLMKIPSSRQRRAY